jgi:hypothetical protein
MGAVDLKRTMYFQRNKRTHSADPRENAREGNPWESQWWKRGCQQLHQRALWEGMRPLKVGSTTAQFYQKVDFSLGTTETSDGCHLALFNSTTIK